LDSYGRIWPFQWVTANPIKKFLSRVTLRRKYHKSRFLFLRWPSWDRARRGLYPVSRNILITDSFFPQAIIREILWARVGPSRRRGTEKLRKGPTATGSYIQYSCILGANRWKALERTLQHASLRNPHRAPPLGDGAVAKNAGVCASAFQREPALAASADPWIRSTFKWSGFLSRRRTASDPWAA
jgi:hypothetical protein